jgi:hypothetical protein
LKRRTRKALKLTAERAAHALHVLISEGKLATTDVAHALRRRAVMIADLRERLAALEGGVVSGIAQARKAVTRKPERKKPRLSAATRAKYRWQGKYLSAMRPLSKQNRAKVRAIRAKSGVKAAIQKAKKLIRT